MKMGREQDEKRMKIGWKQEGKRDGNRLKIGRKQDENRIKMGWKWDENRKEKRMEKE